MQDFKAFIDALCPGLIGSVDHEWPPYVVTTLFYPDGDSILLHMEHGESGPIVTDGSVTMGSLRRWGVEMTPDRSHVIDCICGREGVTREPDGRLSIPVAGVGISTAALTLCHAIAQVSSVYYQQGSPARSPLPRAMDQLIQDRVRPVRPFARNWRDERHDPAGSFPVDYHFNGPLRQSRNLFYVTSNGKALLVAAVVSFLRSHRIYLPTMTVVDTGAGVSGKQVRRLQSVSTEIRFGLDRHRDDIVEFAVGGEPNTADVS